MVEIAVDNVISVKPPSTGVCRVIYRRQTLVPREILSVVYIDRQLFVGVELVDEGLVSN